LIDGLLAEIWYIYPKELRAYEKAIREFYICQNPEATNAKINEYIEGDILEMDWRLTENIIDRKIWELILSYTKDGRRLVEATPEKKPTSLSFDKPDGEITTITIK
jgi:hypothetical protein